MALLDGFENNLLAIEHIGLIFVKMATEKDLEYSFLCP